ncbi:MAG: hypothetical protein JNJ50_17325 [Acidobacteria bacterium]|nr:hypothetical protein [Acidobacteriota bacterium]
MKPLINLASTPFRNRRLFWLAILLLFLVPSYFGLQAIESATKLEGEIGLHDATVKGLEAQLKKVEKPITSKTTISSDENKQLVAASELIARRSFSWSQLLNDIERNLPAGVRVLRVAVTQIQPQEREENLSGNESAATLGLNVIGKAGQDVTTMINKFHETGRFKVVPLTKKAVEGTEEVEFELRVDYFPPMQGKNVSPGNQIASKQVNQSAQTGQIARAGQSGEKK